MNIWEVSRKPETLVGPSKGTVWSIALFINMLLWVAIIRFI